MKESNALSTRGERPARIRFVPGARYLFLSR